MGQIIQLRPKTEAETVPFPLPFRRPLPKDDEDALRIQRVRESLGRINALFAKMKAGEEKK